MAVLADATPDEVLARAEVYFPAHGYTIETRTPNSLTVYTKPEFSWGLGILSILLGGFPFIGYILVLTLVKYRVTVTATPQGERTSVAVSGFADGQDWAAQWVASEWP